MPTANEVMRIAKKQIGYKEYPANSNKTKFGRKFGANGEPWCFIFEWWCGWKAAKKYGGRNPFPHNSNAAYGQDEIVSKMGGKWIMKKTTSKAERKAALKRYKRGDCVDFDFGRFDAYRRHTGLVDKVEDDYVYCIEGNTTPDGQSGPQSNGGMVCRKKRHYTDICSAARPKYDKSKRARIYETAKALAWPFGTPKEKYEYPGGRATKAFRKAIKDVYPNRDSWSTQPSKGASCDVFVGTVIRASGVDKSWPRGLDEIEAHCKKHRKKWKKIRTAKRSRMKPGDVIYQIFDSGAGHVSIYLGGNRIANAHYYGKTYGVVQKFSNHVRSASQCRKSYVYRPR